MPYSKPKPTSKVTDVLRVFWASLRPFKWAFAFVVVLYSLTAVFQVIAPIFYKNFFDVLTGPGAVDKLSTSTTLIHILFIILAVNFGSWLCFRIGTFAINHLEAYVMADLKQKAFEHMINHSYLFFTNNFTGSLVQRVNRLSRAFEKIMDRIVFSIIPLTVFITGTCIVVWRIKPLISIAI